MQSTQIPKNLTPDGLIDLYDRHPIARSHPAEEEALPEGIIEELEGH